MTRVASSYVSGLPTFMCGNLGGNDPQVAKPEVAKPDSNTTQPTPSPMPPSPGERPAPVREPQTLWQPPRGRHHMDFFIGVGTAVVAGALLAWFVGNDALPAGASDDHNIAPTWDRMVMGLQQAWQAL